MSITSDEVNFLVYRYLQESGFQHAAYAFGTESQIHRSNINGGDVPPGALIKFLQKGLQYAEIESHLNKDGSEVPCKEPFSLTVQHNCASRGNASAPASATAPADGMSSGVKLERLADNTLAPASDIEMLKKHSMEVFVCSWNPTTDVLASGSCDGTARIWNWNAFGAASDVALRHDDKQITSLDWSPDGHGMVTGCVDGIARLWNSSGGLVKTLTKHDGAIFSTKYNKKGDYVVTGSMDRSAIVWTAKTGDIIQQFPFHAGPCLDVDWRNNNSFATCSADRTINICRLGEPKPVKTFVGHGDEVNAIQFDPSGALLASCSDDYTVKVWNLKQDNPVHDFCDHSKETYKILWSPAGHNSANPNKPLRLASASYDHTVKLWDPIVGKCTATLANHSDSVYTVAWSPDCEFLASGSTDKMVNIWNVRDACVVRSFKCDGGVFEVAWGPKNRIAAATESGIAVYDFRM